MEHPPSHAPARPQAGDTGLSGPRWRPVTEGWPILLPLVLLGLVGLLVVPPVGLLLLLAAGAVVLAFRDPERVVIPQPDVALAPADGRVINVTRVHDAYWETEMIEVAIFLALWDVHVQRSPLAGTVVARQHKAGGYKPAMSEAATHGNNQLASYMHTAAGPCVVTQISGLIARRLVTWGRPGAGVEQGQRLGMIKFGSQVTLRLPVTSTVLVAVGDHVRAGLTPVARVVVDQPPGPTREPDHADAGA